MRFFIILSLLIVLSGCVSKPAREYFGPELPRSEVGIVTIEDMDKLSDIISIASYTKIDNKKPVPRRVDNKELHLLPGTYLFKVKCVRYRILGANLAGYPTTVVNVQAGKTYFLGCLSSPEDEIRVSARVKRVSITK